MRSELEKGSLKIQNTFIWWNLISQNLYLSIDHLSDLYESKSLLDKRFHWRFARPAARLLMVTLIRCSLSDLKTSMWIKGLSDLKTSMWKKTPFLISNLYLKEDSFPDLKTSMWIKGGVPFASLTYAKMHFSSCSLMEYPFKNHEHQISIHPFLNKSIKSIT